jgi:ligand-binding SRPBCC domain-containing protein
MPRFEKEMSFARPVAEVFDFFCWTENLLRLTPPEFRLSLIEGPDRLGPGVRLTLKGRRWGISHLAISEITTFVQGKSFVDQQVQGPLGKWLHTHVFETIPGGTRVRDQIDYEPPGGMLGLVVTGSFLERDLEGIFAYREGKLRALLGGEPP